MVTNIEIARLLRKIAAAYTILNENRFKIIAYENAATAVEHATSELQDLWEEKKMDTIAGLGPSITAHLDEIFRTGKSKHFEEVLKKVNPAVFSLLEVPGLGPKKAQKLVKSLKLKSLDDLEKAGKAHKIAKLESFGEKSEKDILENIDRYKKGAIKEKRMTLPAADLIADEIIKYLGVKADKLGSLRRQVATIGDIDLAVATNEPENIIKKFLSYPSIVEVIEKGPTGASVLLAAGRQVDLRVSTPQTYGAMLQYFTGSKYHNIKLRELAIKKHLKLNEYGIDGKVFKTETELYNYLELDYIPPELREDTGEVEAALAHKLPKLIELSDIKGDLQMHSSYAQGTSHDSGADSISEMMAKANTLEYEYIAITDHNPSQSQHTAEQINNELKRRREYFVHISSSTKTVRVINMLEVDILPNGKLAVPQEGLDYLDGCLVSIHSSFNLSKEDMTKRVLTGLSNPVARIFAHPTGKLLGQRDGYDLDWDKVFKFCLDHNKALEINAFSNRLDLTDTLVREAVKFGVKLSIGTDAHNKEDLVLMKYGVSVARRGWAQKQNILNTLSHREILNWIKLRT